MTVPAILQIQYSTMAHRKSQKIRIQHTFEPGVSLVGILEQIEPSTSTKGRPIALVSPSYHKISTCGRFDYWTSVDFAWDDGVRGHSLTLIELLVCSLLTACPSHKNYLFQKALAVRLPLDSFRFDFRYLFLCVGYYYLLL